MTVEKIMAELKVTLLETQASFKFINGQELSDAADVILRQHILVNSLISLLAETIVRLPIEVKDIQQLLSVVRTHSSEGERLEQFSFLVLAGHLTAEKQAELIKFITHNHKLLSKAREAVTAEKAKGEDK